MIRITQLLDELKYQISVASDDEPDIEIHLPGAQFVATKLAIEKDLRGELGGDAKEFMFSRIWFVCVPPYVDAGEFAEGIELSG